MLRLTEQRVFRYVVAGAAIDKYSVTLNYTPAQPALVLFCHFADPPQRHATPRMYPSSPRTPPHAALNNCGCQLTRGTAPHTPRLIGTPPYDVWPGRAARAKHCVEEGSSLHQSRELPHQYPMHGSMPLNAQ